MVEAQVKLLRLFLAHRKDVVEHLQGVLNAQRKPPQHLQDRSSLSHQIEDCFYKLAEVSDEQARLRGQLQTAYLASGFRPRQVAELFNDLVNPAEMMIRGFYCWQKTRWPGRNGRIRYAHTLFDLYLIRQLQLLSLRLWDDGSSSAGERLVLLQAVLQELWQSAPADQPVLVQNACWLIPLAQSPTTDELAAYFETAKQVAETLEAEDRLEIQKAHVQMIGGHLRSQIRHYCVKDGVSINETSVVLRTRTSNALDFALLIQHLVSLLDGYEHARETGDGVTRLELAAAICQGISPDPELFLNRIDLLGACSMIEHLFIDMDREGRVDYTPMGRRHLQMFLQYQVSIERSAAFLLEDFPQFKWVNGTYSPYGAIYGTPTNLIEDMALKTLQRDAVAPFGLEDVFSDGEADKLAWVNGWRDLPHVDRDVKKLYQYPQQYAEEIYGRIEHELQRCQSNGEESDVLSSGCLFILPEDASKTDSKAALIADLPIQYIGSSDEQIVADGKAVFYEPARLLRDRQEGYFVLSYQTIDGWVAIKKDMLTQVLGQGKDAKIVGLPTAAAQVLGLMCPKLVQASVPDR